MSGKLVPSSRPQMGRAEVMQLAGALPAGSVKVGLVGVRGYYRDSMGKPGVNDRGSYDDAIFLISEDTFVAFNANTDPSRFRSGIATLKAGLWWYKLGIHGLSKPPPQRYEALVQAGAVTVLRDAAKSGGAPVPDTGWFGINIHRGGNSTTSSLGCQTIPPAQWDGFISTVKAQLRAHGQKTLPYLLIDNA